MGIIGGKGEIMDILKTGMWVLWRMALYACMIGTDRRSNQNLKSNPISLLE